MLNIVQSTLFNHVHLEGFISTHSQHILCIIHSLRVVQASCQAPTIRAALTVTQFAEILWKEEIHY